MSAQIYSDWFERLYKRVQQKYPNLYGIKPEPKKVPDYPQVGIILTQAEIDKRWDNYPKKRANRRFLVNSGANAAR